MILTDTCQIEWQDADPPERIWHTRGQAEYYPYHLLAAAVRSLRGDWVLVHDLPAPLTFVAQANQGFQRGFTPANEFELARRGSVVYIRYTGAGPDAPEPELLERDAPPLRITYMGFEEPLPQIARGPLSITPGAHLEVSMALRSRPGRWAIVRDALPDIVTMINRGDVYVYRPGGSYEAVSRNGEVWARYLGDSHAA